LYLMAVRTRAGDLPGVFPATDLDQKKQKKKALILDMPLP